VFFKRLSIEAIQSLSTFVCWLTKLCSGEFLRNCSIDSHLSLNPKIRYRVYKSPPLFFVLSRINPVSPFLRFILSLRIVGSFFRLSDQNLVYFSHLPILSFPSGASKQHLVSRTNCDAPHRAVFPRPLSLHPQYSAPYKLTGNLWSLYVPPSVYVFGWRSQWWQHSLSSLRRATNFTEQSRQSLGY